MATKRKKRPDGNYAIRRKVKPYKDKNGKIQEYKTFYGKTVKEAKDKFDKYKAGADQTPLFFDDLIKDFIENTFLPDPKYKPGTKHLYIDSYRHNLEPQKDFIYKPIEDITYRDVQAAYNKMTCKPSGVESCHKLLAIFFKLMIATGTIKQDPLIGVIVPKPDKKSPTGEIITFTDEEISKIKAYINRRDLPAFEQKRIDRFRLLILLAIHTGMRAAELLALRYDDIQNLTILINKQVVSKPIFEDGKTSGYQLVIAEPKSSKSVRSVPITEDLKQAVADHEQWHKKEMLLKGYRTGYIFTTSKGKLYDKHSVRHSLNRIHAAAGVPEYGLHTYRRTFATKLAKAGTPIQVLADLLGHASIEITAKYYIGISDEQKRQAISKL